MAEEAAVIVKVLYIQDETCCASVEQKESIYWQRIEADTAVVRRGQTMSEAGSRTWQCKHHPLI